MTDLSLCALCFGMVQRLLHWLILVAGKVFASAYFFPFPAVVRHCEFLFCFYLGSLRLKFALLVYVLNILLWREGVIDLVFISDQVLLIVLCADAPFILVLKGLCCF